MGCTASKLDNEDTVRRCKERRRLMKDAVYARHNLAAAHSDYCRSLRVTGSALTAFAAGEPLSVSDHTPAVLLRTPSSVNNNNYPSPPTIPSAGPSSFHPPPPPPFPPSPSPTIASFKLPHILSASSLSSHPRPKPVKVKLPHILSESSLASSPPRSEARFHHHQNPNHHPNRPNSNIKLPHILSESSFAYSPQSEARFGRNKSNSNHYAAEDFTYNANSTFSSTPSQASSVWNWENFYPPSPPDSEFFQRRQNDNGESDHDDKSSVYSKTSTFSHMKQQINHPNPNHHHHLDNSDEEMEMEREEVHCSEWGDHYSTTSSSSDGEQEDDDLKSRSGTRSNFESSVHNEPKAATTATTPLPAASMKSKFSRMSKSDKSDNAGSSVSWNAGNTGEISDMRMVVRHRDLAEIVAAIKDYFDKAASAGEQVSEMLENGRAQLDRSFRQLKKKVYHSSGVFSNLSSSWTSKPPLAVKYLFEPVSIDEPGGPRSLCSTLERLLAWEKKLYQEVKAREGVKIEHEKKLSALQNQEYKGDEAKVDKTKASISTLQSLIVVTSQAVSTTSSAIIGLRDAEIVPQLVELCHGFMYMWRSMNQFHEVQNHVVQQVRGLVNRSTKGESTSDLHRQATRDLESAISAWHSCFCRLIKFERDFIRSLHGWFKLTFVPVDTEQTNVNREPSEVFSFCDEWRLALDRLPDTVASEAIKSFINVVHSISLKQAEELKIKKRTESASKELEKKASSLRNIEKKYYHSYSMAGIGLPDTGPDNNHVLDARDPLSEKKTELAACQRRVEDEMLRHSKAVEVTRAMTLNNIQTGLPGVFQAMTSFSALIVEALEVVCNSSYAIK